MPNYVSINPGSAVETPQEGKREFSALVRVESSRYAEHKYQDETLKSKIAIRWTLQSTKGTTFEKDWTTGLNWDPSLISPDGKKLTTAIKKNSDAFYMLQKAVNEAGFPSNKLTDDISVFDGETFYITTDQNPRSNGSARKSYPKKYHAEGWEAAKAESIKRQMERQSEYESKMASGSNETATMTRSYTPPVVILPEVRNAATEALIAILSHTPERKAVQRDLLTGLNQYVERAKPTWATTQSTRENVTRALWEYTQLTSIIQGDTRFTVEGGPIGFTITLNPF